MHEGKEALIVSVETLQEEVDSLRTELESSEADAVAARLNHATQQVELQQQIIAERTADESSQVRGLFCYVTNILFLLPVFEFSVSNHTCSLA
jgi:hypothetical protein